MSFPVRKDKRAANFKINKIRKFVFNNNPYKIVWKNKKFKGGHYAECTDPKSSVTEIRISPKVLEDQKVLLSTLCDEAIHTHFYIDRLSNEEVDKLSDDLAKFLWKIGWRLPEKD